MNAPLRGELELAEYGRDHLELLDCKATDNVNQGRTTLSIPLLTFIDGVGLYRNTYRTLVGIYFIFAGLPFQERIRRANVIPFTLAPHGSNFADVIAAVQDGLAALDRGIEVDTTVGKVLLNVFSLAFIREICHNNRRTPG